MFVNGYNVTGNHASSGRLYRVENLAGELLREFVGLESKYQARNAANEMPSGDVPEPLPDPPPEQPPTIAAELPPVGTPAVAKKRRTRKPAKRKGAKK